MTALAKDGLSSTEKGFVPGADLLFKAKTKTGDYHDQMDGNNFLKYIEEKLIPNIPQKSIVVMDNAPYHSMQTNKAPSSATRKADIKEWLREHGIEFDDSLTKPELLEIVKKNKPEKTYIIDELFAKHGHEVLRIPPYNCDLNPIEYVWNLIKQRVAEKNVDQLESRIEGMTRDAIASITENDWAKEVNHVKRLEQKYWDRDVGCEKEIEDLIINLGVESDTDDEDDGESSEGDISGIDEIDEEEAGPSTA